MGNILFGKMVGSATSELCASLGKTGIMGHYSINGFGGSIRYGFGSKVNRVQEGLYRIQAIQKIYAPYLSDIKNLLVRNGHIL